MTIDNTIFTKYEIIRNENGMAINIFTLQQKITIVKNFATDI